MMKRFFPFVAFLVTFGAVAQVEEPLQFLEETHDFGMIPEDGGPVTQDFVFTNMGNRPVTILSVKASCGCTTTGWTQDPVAPGKTGFVKAQYDPTARPGYFNKSLTVTTDYDGRAIILQVKGQVVSGSTMYPGDFRMANGSLRLRTSSLNMGTVYHDTLATVKDFLFFNEGEKPVKFLDPVEAPEYIRVSVSPTIVEPHKQGAIRLAYLGAARKEYGFQSDNVTLHTDDDTSPVKSFSVYATLEDDFSGLSAAQLAAAPVLKLEGDSFDYGRVDANKEFVKQLTFSNGGKSPLEVRFVQGNCSCISATVSRTKIPPGETATLVVHFNPEDRRGSQLKAVTLYSNDPKTPVKRLTFTAYVEM